MLNLWYQNALLFWYRFFNLFTDNIKARIRMKNEELRNEVRRPKGKPMKNCRLHRLRNKVRPPNFVS